MNRNIAEYTFLEAGSTATEASLNLPEPAMTLCLQVDATSTVDISVKGKINANSSTYNSITCVNASTLATSEKITAAGMYYISMDGVYSVKVVNNGTAGSATAFGVIIG